MSVAVRRLQTRYRSYDDDHLREWHKIRADRRDMFVDWGRLYRPSHLLTISWVLSPSEYIAHIRPRKGLAGVQKVVETWPSVALLRIVAVLRRMMVVEERRRKGFDPIVLRTLCSQWLQMTSQPQSLFGRVPGLL